MREDKETSGWEALLSFIAIAAIGFMVGTAFGGWGISILELKLVVAR